MENKLSYDELLIKVDQLETVSKIICYIGNGFKFP